MLIGIPDCTEVVLIWHIRSENLDKQLKDARTSNSALLKSFFYARTVRVTMTSRPQRHLFASLRHAVARAERDVALYHVPKEAEITVCGRCNYHRTRRMDAARDWVAEEHTPHVPKNAFCFLKSRVKIPVEEDINQFTQKGEQAARSIGSAYHQSFIFSCLPST